MVGESDAVQRWNQALEAKIAGGTPRNAAVRQLVRDDPNLHRAFLVATNEAAGRVFAVRQLQGSGV